MPKPSAPPANDRKRGSGVKHVYDVLRDEIIDLHLAPGSPIDEIMLAERFAMSRTPIREALVRLASEGLVTTLPLILTRPSAMAASASSSGKAPARAKPRESQSGLYLPVLLFRSRAADNHRGVFFDFTSTYLRKPRALGQL